MRRFRAGVSPDLIPRILSALVLAPIVLGAVWLGGVPFQIMLGIVVVLAAYEWTHLTCGPGWYIDAVIIAGTALGAMQLAIIPGYMPTYMDDFSRLGFVAAAIISGMALLGSLGSIRGQPLRWRLLGVPYISLGPASLIWLRGQEDSGFLLTIWLLLLIWAMDIGAYIAGRAIGGPKLAPRASPNKTWAGLIGGMLSAAIVGGFFGWIAPLVTDPAPVLHMALMSALIGAWSQVGDIAESMVKRHFGVKDMSNLIPGHGGILDRIDGLLFAAPAMAIGVLIVLVIGT